MEFSAYLARLADTARARADVVGLAGFGSTADRSRRDEWSDHDFAWITVPGAEERYRRTDDWLPDPHRIVARVVEHHGGVKVVYDDGHLAEFGVTALDGLATWAMNRAVALVDEDGAIQRVLDAAATDPAPPDPADELALAAAAVLVGVGRARRGEVLSGGDAVRGAGVAHLLRALAATSRGAFPPLDPLDPHRRVEQVHPELAARIAAASALPVEPSGRALLDLVAELADDRVRPAVSAVRRRLGWTG